MSATFFLSSSWFINQEKDKKQSMRETWVQSYFSPLHCLSSSLILKRVEPGVVYPFSKISKLQFMTLTFLDILLRHKACLRKISKLTEQTFKISDNSLLWEFKSSAEKITKVFIRSTPHLVDRRASEIFLRTTQWAEIHSYFIV